MTGTEMDDMTPHDRRIRQARDRVNRIMDPCSKAAAVPLGLIDMGIVRDVSVRAETVMVEVLPTFPACRFVPIFEAEIKERLDELEWVKTVKVQVAPPDVIWDESRLSEAAQQRLAERRRHTDGERASRQARMGAAAAGTNTPSRARRGQ